MISNGSSWSGCMVAQFAGVDAYGLIKMIADAAQTVRRNRATCLQLARRAKMIGDLLHQLHAAQLMQQPETRNPMEQLEETLRRALQLVRSCQGRGYLYRCFMGARHADELREVQGEITFYGSTSSFFLSSATSTPPSPGSDSSTKLVLLNLLRAKRHLW
ncbi:hypothetical protein ACQJBY_032466 [Aegilops geniculata]